MRHRRICAFCVFVCVAVSGFAGGTCGIKVGAGRGSSSPLQDSVSSIVDTIRLRQGWQKENVKIVGVDLDEARVGKGCLYDVSVGVGDKVFDFNLASEVLNWEQLKALPEGRESEEHDFSATEKALHLWQPPLGDATLPEFDLAGPVELWIQEADNLRLSVPHDVDAGLLKKVVIADGAVVTIKGAREVSLMRPLQLPLPLVKPPQATEQSADEEEGQPMTAAGLMGLAARLRKASRESEQPVLSLKVVGASSLVAANASPEDGAISRLKVRRLAPGAVELVTSEQAALEEMAGSATADDFLEETTFAWPLPEVEAGDKRLLGFEQALLMVLGNQAYSKGSFKLLKGKASAVTIVHVPFELEHRKAGKTGISAESAKETALTEKDEEEEERVERQSWEAVVKYEGGKVQPIRAQQVLKAEPTISFSWSDLTANGSLVRDMWVAGPPPSLTSLEPDWNGLG
eukprot:TRINITY_DN5212_c0_g1_i1.p1 TRINITY_DN5212_c0_g1~~TRINITY_DN5212_c0_g1_i1.p1  ORF type:complete len:460 (-),score=109.97 TRINITY_DN5212_c0_g1_i1:494-1873(-)